MSILNADLHCHSTASDGTLNPEALAERARQAGVELWSLTDHDTVEGQAAAAAAARAHGLPYLTGVEISVTFAHITAHIVGLGFDPEHTGLRAGLDRIRNGRDARAHEMGEQLARLGIPGAYEGALRHAGSPQRLSRTHFARHLVDSGVCRDTHEVFRRYLSDGKPGHVPHRWAGLGEAVSWIRDAGGVAVIAHPARYPHGSTEEWALFSEFREHGGQAVEVVTGSHTPAEYLRYADMALEFGLWASRGSDFHSPAESRTDLGALPYLEGRLTPVWEPLHDRIT